jgi:hypothetical protein
VTKPPGHPLLKKKKKKKRWPNHPQGQTLKNIFEGLTLGGGQTTPLGHGGSLATPRLASLRVAKPTPWPKGWPATPYGVVRPPLYFIIIIFFNSATPLSHGGGSPKGWPATLYWVFQPPLYIYIFYIIDFIFKLNKKINILMGQKWCISSKVTTVNKIGQRGFYCSFRYTQVVNCQKKKKKNLKI